MYLCAQCMSVGYCRWRPCRLVSDSELSNPEFIRDIRNFSASLGKSPVEMLDHLMEGAARFEGCIVDERWERIELSFDVFEPTDKEIDEGYGETARNRIIEWIETIMCRSCPDHVRPRVRKEARNRFRVFATALRACYPREAMMWGMRAANDNEPPTDQKPKP